MQENNESQIDSKKPRKRGRPHFSEDGRRRECVSGSAAATTADKLEDWRKARNAVKPLTKMGELLDHLIPWAAANGYDPTN